MTMMAGVPIDSDIFQEKKKKKREALPINQPFLEKESNITNINLL